MELSVLQSMGYNSPFKNLSDKEKNLYWAEIAKRYRKRNPARAAESKKRSEIKHRAAKLARLKKWHLANKEHERAYKKNRFKDPAVKKRHSECNIAQAKRHMPTRLAARLRTRLHEALFKKRFSKSLRLNPDDLAQHLKERFLTGMTWKNYGTLWHIDHIIPCRAFDLSKPEQVTACFALSNLQPLWAVDNFLKNDKMPDGTSAKDIVL